MTDKPQSLNKAIRLTNAIDKFVYRRMAQITANDKNAQERMELAEVARKEMQDVIEGVLI